MDLRQIYLSNEGRIARLPYFGYSLALTIPYMLLAYLLVSLLGALGSVLILASYAVIAYPYYCLMAKRLQDFNQPGKWAIAVIGLGLLASVLQFVEALQGVGLGLSVVQMLVGFAILLLPGTTGTNDYGKQPGAAVTA
jgi:uncharacterized membrane protein YhaH (DUF805 family)